MRGVNRVHLIGNLGKDVEVRYMPDGKAVANTSLGTNEEWKDKQTGEKQSRVEWHNLTFYGKLAEIAGEYLKKGSQIYVEGSIRTEKWQDKEGKDRFTTKIIVSEMQMLGGKRIEETGDAGKENPDRIAKNASQDHNSVEFDDDIPF